MTSPVYLGVDVAGADNTWVAALSPDGDDGLVVVHGPRQATLEEVVGYCEENNVVATAIDAQLTVAISDENGFRTSDDELRKMLAETDGSHRWVASINSLMAVPIRGRMLADHLSPIVGTMLETHPRACLWFGLTCLGEEVCTAIRKYKCKKDDTRERRDECKRHTRELWRLWSERFGVSYEGDVSDDGALDALVCATVAYLFHRAPDALLRLRHDVPGKTGRGPFYVLASGVKTQP
jgi:predicted nuclease with RNAse H fold